MKKGSVVGSFRFCPVIRHSFEMALNERRQMSHNEAGWPLVSVTFPQQFALHGDSTRLQRSLRYT